MEELTIEFKEHKIALRMWKEIFLGPGNNVCIDIELSTILAFPPKVNATD